MALSLADRQVFNNVATDLRIKNTQWLIDLVNFESGFNPKAKNPLSSARGLIQFIDSTAKGMGYADSLDIVNKYPTLQAQLEGPVKKYLQTYAPYSNEHELYMAVFFPVARNYPANTSFKQIFKETYGRGWETKYSRFKKGNPGILSPADYVNYVKKKPIIRVATKSGAVIVAGLLIYLLYKRFK